MQSLAFTTNLDTLIIPNVSGLCADQVVVAFFIGDKDVDTGVSWCPDCVDAEPIIMKALSKTQKITLVEISVGSRDQWKDKCNVYRIHPDTQLTQIPTLMKWTKNGPCRSVQLVNQDCADLEKETQLHNVEQSWTWEFDE